MASYSQTSRVKYDVALKNIESFWKDQSQTHIKLAKSLSNHSIQINSSHNFTWMFLRIW